MIKNLNSLVKMFNKLIDERLAKKKMLDIYVVNTINIDNFTVSIKHPNFKNLIYENVPISSIGLGNFKGVMKLPSEGDFVVVGFLNGNEQAPIILNTIFNQTIHGQQQNPVIQEDELLLNSKEKGSYIVIKPNNDIIIRTTDASGNKAGSIKVTTAGQIILNGGTKSVARVGDSVHVIGSTGVASSHSHSIDLTSLIITGNDTIKG